MNIQGLKIGLTLYGSWANLARAGFHNEILKEYVNYRIQLTQNDIQELRRIFLCPHFDDRWLDLINQYKEKNESTSSAAIENNNPSNHAILPAVL